MTDRDDGTRKVRIAHLAGPNATITNTPPLITSNKARELHGLPLLRDCEGAPSRFDPLRPQRLAAPVIVYVEQYSAHPLEADAADLYGPPDGYLGSDGTVREARADLSDKPVYRIELRPEDGLYPLPYMARQTDGSAWDGDAVRPMAERKASRQPFFPDGSRLFEEIDRLGIDVAGRGNNVGDIADVSFFRIAPSAGYMRDDGDSADAEMPCGEVPGRDFFPYRPVHLHMSPNRGTLAHITNRVRDILASGTYDGAIWTQGSPRIEETIYWLSLTIDTDALICGCASQRYHGQISNDGPRNIVDATHLIRSDIWRTPDGRNRIGAVLVQDQRIFAAREVAKVDARPGGYEATGGHGGIIGGAAPGATVLRYFPATRFGMRSAVHVGYLPSSVNGLARVDGRTISTEVIVKDAAGALLPDAIPRVAILKDASYVEDGLPGDPAEEVDIIALVDRCLAGRELGGFVLEGLNPYGKPASLARDRALRLAIHSGFPVVVCGRGNTQGFALSPYPYIGGSNLTATKARLLLMLCVMKFGMLPAAVDPAAPTPEEQQDLRLKLADYQAVFDEH